MGQLVDGRNAAAICFLAGDGDDRDRFSALAFGVGRVRDKGEEQPEIVLQMKHADPIAERAERFVGGRRAGIVRELIDGVLQSRTLTGELGDDKLERRRYRDVVRDRGI